MMLRKREVTLVNPERSPDLEVRCDFFGVLIRFFRGWLLHDYVNMLVREHCNSEDAIDMNLTIFTNEATKWNASVFEELSKKKKRFLPRINGLQKPLKTHCTKNMIALKFELRDELEAILDYEELILKIKSRSE